MAITIIANGHLGTLKKQRVSTNTTSVQLSQILNDANIIPPITNEPGKVFSFWGTTINGFDVGDYTINQLYSSGAITKDGILNLYANYSYSANNIQITFNANGGKFADGTTTKAISVPLGSIYAELESTIDLPTLSGKAFKAWTDPSNIVINGYSEFLEAIVISAQWEDATNVNIAVKDSRGKSVISGSYPKATLWKDLYAKAISNGYAPDDATKPFSKILPGYGSYTGQAIKSIDFSVANNPMKVGWLRGTISELSPKKIRDFLATAIPVDPRATFAVTGKVTNRVTLTYNPIGDTETPYSPAPEDTKPGLWLNDDWLYNPYTQKWLDTPIDNADYSYSNSIITFKNYFNVQYVTGDISKVRDSVTATVKSVVAGYGSTTDNRPLYNNSYFPSNDSYLPNNDSGATLKIEEYLGYAYIIFYNQNSGHYQKIYQQAGTKYSEFLKLISKPKFDMNGRFMKGFYTSNYWVKSKLIAGMPINAPIEYAFSGYSSPTASTFVRVTFDANGGSFYKGTSYETASITLEVSALDTYGIIINYLPDVSKRTLGVLFWVMDLVNMEPAYPLTVKNGQTLYPKWTITDKVELYRKPREYYLIDLNSVYNGWDTMDKFSLSDKNNIFVIDPTGTGVSYSEDKSSFNGWSKYNRDISSNVIEFEAYYNGYNQYNRLGRWVRGKELVLAMLNETGIPTYWTVDIAEIERTEIKYGEDLLHGKISFNKTSPAFDLEFIGLGTDNTIDNSDDMFRRNAYVYIHSLKVPDDDKGIQIIATDGKTTIEDSVDIDLPAGSYFEYSTLPFRELWKYGSSWNNLTNNLYNNIIDLVGARPIKVGIGKWDISVSSSNKVTINSLAPHKIQDYAGKTIDSLGGLGPFTGIVIKEKEL